MVIKTKVTLITMVLLFLTACGPIYQTHYTYQPPDNPHEKNCIAQCQENRNVCRSNCQDQQQQCKSRAREKAEFEYKMYKTKRQREGKPIQKSLSDFYNQFGCFTTQQNCDCEHEYRQCYRMCGGKVIAHRRCVAFCNQQS